MGSSHSMGRGTSSEEEVERLKGKVRLLQREINKMMQMREDENQDHQQEKIASAFREVEWKTERRRLREEVSKLKKKLKEREETIRVMEEEVMVGGKSCDGKGWHLVGYGCLLEQMKEEKALRDGAVERWKQLYLAIKNELDHLIQRTNQGEGLCWRAEKEEQLLEELQSKVKAREETIEVLKAKVASLEQEKTKWEREVDILRQSLRIISYKQQQQQPRKGLPRNRYSEDTV